MFWRKSYLILLFLAVTPVAVGQTCIHPDDPSIRYGGAFFNKISDSLAVFQRHSDTFLALPQRVSQVNPRNARTTSGIYVSFKTDADKTEIYFRMLPGRNDFVLFFSLYVDGDEAGMLQQKRDDLTRSGDSLFVLKIPAPSPGAHTYTVVLPTFAHLALVKIMLAGGSGKLLPLPAAKKPVYIAYGNSITHGQGQHTGDQTYPWILAGAMGWDMYNLAVGGSRTSVAMARMIADEIKIPIDFMTILIGFNDAVFQGVDTAVYHRRLEDFITTVRRGHPETTIFVLGQTYTDKKSDKKGRPLNFDDWRKVQQEVVHSLAAAGDRHIHFINGAALTGHDDLFASPKNKVHLSVEGAARFGKALAERIQKVKSNK